jgi:hypothetical protein
MSIVVVVKKADKVVIAADTLYGLGQQMSSKAISAIEVKFINVKSPSSVLSARRRTTMFSPILLKITMPNYLFPVSKRFMKLT